jgi:hypothetical protein
VQFSELDDRLSGMAYACIEDLGGHIDEEIKLAWESSPQLSRAGFAPWAQETFES